MDGILGTVGKVVSAPINIVKSIFGKSENSKEEKRVEAAKIAQPEKKILDLKIKLYVPDSFKKEVESLSSVSPNYKILEQVLGQLPVRITSNQNGKNFDELKSESNEFELEINGKKIDTDAVVDMYTHLNNQKQADKFFAELTVFLNPASDKYQNIDSLKAEIEKYQGPENATRKLPASKKEAKDSVNAIKQLSRANVSTIDDDYIPYEGASRLNPENIAKPEKLKVEQDSKKSEAKSMTDEEKKEFQIDRSMFRSPEMMKLVNSITALNITAEITNSFVNNPTKDINGDNVEAEKIFTDLLQPMTALTQGQADLLETVITNDEGEEISKTVIGVGRDGNSTVRFDNDPSSPSVMILKEAPSGSYRTEIKYTESPAPEPVENVSEDLSESPVEKLDNDSDTLEVSNLDSDEPKSDLTREIGERHYNTI